MKKRVSEICKYNKKAGNILEKSYEELERLYEACQSGKVNDVKAYMKAEKELNDILKAYENQLSTGVFSSIAEIYDYLLDEGYKVGERTLYDHKQKGYLVGIDNKYLKSEVDDYAEKYLKKNENIEYGGSLVDARNKADIALKKLKAEREQIAIDEQKGKLIEREIVAREFASRIEIIKRLLGEISESLPILLKGKSEIEMKNIIDDRIKYVLETYAGKLESLR